MTTKWFALLLVGNLIAPASAQLTSEHRFKLNLSQVTQAIVRAFAQRGIETNSTQIAPLSEVIATEPDPVFDIRSIHSRGDRTTIELSCHRPAICLPFLAVTNELVRKADQADAQEAASSPIIMHVGTHGTLRMNHGQLHLQISVVSLGSGAANSIIRVRSTDRKRIFSARIINADTLEARF
jgi:hypothetical protein